MRYAIVSKKRKITENMRRLRYMKSAKGDKIVSEHKGNIYGLRHNKHTVSLLTDYLVITLKYRAKYLLARPAVDFWRISYV